MTIWGDIALDGPRRTVTIERRYSAEVRDVWSAITEPERLSRWLGRIEVRDDGYALTMLEDDKNVVGTVVTCEPERRIVVGWTYSTEKPSELEVSLTGDGRGCVLRLTHRRLQAVGASSYGAGWEDFLADLGAFLGTSIDFGGFPSAQAEYRAREAALVPARIEREDDRSRVRLERLLEASVRDVWSAITEPDRIGRWLWPVISWPDDPARARALLAGDSFVLGDENMPDGRQPFTVVAMDPMASIELTWGEIPLRIALEATTDGTRLTLEQGPAGDAFGAGRMRSGPDYAAGWHTLVDGLTLLLEEITVPNRDELWAAAYTVYAPKD